MSRRRGTAPSVDRARWRLGGATREGRCAKRGELRAENGRDPPAPCVLRNRGHYGRSRSAGRAPRVPAPQTKDPKPGTVAFVPSLESSSPSTSRPWSVRRSAGDKLAERSASRRSTARRELRAKSCLYRSLRDRSPCPTFLGSFGPVFRCSLCSPSRCFGARRRASFSANRTRDHTQPSRPRSSTHRTPDWLRRNASHASVGTTHPRSAPSTSKHC